jgi:nucleoid-associated protein YgaU
MPTEYPVVSGDTLSSLAQRFYGDSSLFPVIAVVNNIADPDQIDVGQQLLIPYVTFRHQVVAGDGEESLAQQFYNDPNMVQIIPIANHAAQRTFIVGEWLLIPDLANAGHHTVVAGETWEVLADRWYGESSLWPIVMIANHKENQDPPLNQAIAQPGLNWRHTVVDGDTLWELSTSYYGNTSDDRTKTMVQMVAAANHIDDPDQLPVGEVIFFPSFD